MDCIKWLSLIGYDLTKIRSLTLGEQFSVQVSRLLLKLKRLNMENKNKIKLQSLKEKITTKLDGKMECLEEIITRVDYVATIIRMLLFIYIILKTFDT